MKKSINLNNTYDLDFDGNSFTVGCQEIDYDKAVEAAKWILEQKKEEFYRIGQRFKHKCSNAIYILARVGYNKICLVNMNNGHIWTDYVVVKCLSEITKSEMDKITDNQFNEFTLIN